MRSTSSAAAAADQLLTIQQAADRCGVGRSTFYRWIGLGLITVTDIGKGPKGDTKLRVAESDLAAFQAANRIPGRRAA